MSLKKKTGAEPTVAAVVAYAAQLRARGERAMTEDPYSSPYMPTDGAARKLSQRHGPERALAELAARAVMHDRQAREDDQTAHYARARHHRRITDHVATRAQQRNGQTLGQRLDAALAQLCTVAAAPTASLQADLVHGGKDESPIPRSQGDPSRKARERATELVQWIEDQLESARRRRVELEDAA